MKNRVRVGASALVAVAAAVLAAACGGSGSPGASPTTGADGAGALAAYTACLARNGVTLPSRTPRSPRPSFSPGQTRGPGSGGGFGGGGFGGGGGLFGSQAPAGVDQATWDKATQACSSLRPTAGPNANNSRFAAYRNCLANHGVTMTGPLNTADPTFVAADKACAALRPTPRPRPSTTPTPGA